MGIIQGLVSTLRGMLPGTSEGAAIEDVVSLDSRRLSKYRANWFAYWGEDLNMMLAEDKTPATRINFLKRNIDKVVYFAFGKGMSMSHARYQRQLDLASQCWGPQKIKKLTEVGQQGSITGDVFIMVAPISVTNKVTQSTQTPQTETTEKTPDSQIRVVVIPSEYCRAEYNPFDKDSLTKIEINVPFQVKNADGTYTTMYQHTGVTDEDISYGVKDSSMGVYGPSMQEKGGDLSRMPNPIKSIYVVHIRNYPGGNSIYGCDDITEAAPLNAAYTERLTDIGSIVAYQSAPITCVYGAKAGNLQKGPNKIWGNLPSRDKAHVENLEMKSDLRAANEHLGKIKEGLHEITGVPEIAQGSAQAISNTSGIALHTMYLPLIERADTKQQFYGPLLVEVDILALRWCQALGLMTIVDPSTGKAVTVESLKSDGEWNDLRYNTEIRWRSPLPKDHLIAAQVQVTLVTAGLQSKRGALIELGVKDPDLRLEEIAEDAADAMERAQEMMSLKTQADPNKPAATADTAGNESIDEGGSSLNSGAGSTQGTTSTDSGAPKGRPTTG